MSREFETFFVPCRKCIHCRLQTAREKAVRCWHESQMHANNCFITLTYDDDHFESPYLIYPHFQTFMKDLRNKVGHSPESRISCMVTGEYGDEKKRPHWHAILFNYEPPDSEKVRTTKLGHDVYKSQELTDLWGRGSTEYGSVTIESANYVARYAAKKLVHGRDEEHNFHPIHRTSSKNAIGKSWIEKYHQQTFENGYIRLPNGKKGPIPRYYTDWYRKKFPDLWMKYAGTIKQQQQLDAKERNHLENLEYLEDLWSRDFHDPSPLTRNRVREIIQERKQEALNKNRKDNQ